MSSLFDIGKSGLQSYRQALSVTGQNIANINTDGYKRREAGLEEVSGSQGGITSLSSQTGLGVRVGDIRRSFDEFLLNKARSSTSYAQTSTTYLTSLEQLENLLLPGDSNLGNSLSGFFGALSEISAAPADLSPRVVALEQGKMLAGTFNQLSSNLDSLRTGVVTQTKQKIEELNLLTADLVTLNNKLVGSGAGKAQNALLDARDNLIDQIGAYAEVTVSMNSRGAATLNLGNSVTGPKLVDGGKQILLGHEVLENSIGFRLNPNIDNISTSQLTNGSLRGFADAYQMVTQKMAEIDNLAFTFAREINAVHQQGLDLEGQKAGVMFNVIQPSIVTAEANKGTAAATVLMTDAGKVSPDSIRFSFSETSNKWTGRNERGAIVATGRSTISLPGMTLTLSGTPKDADEFVLRTASGAAAGLSMALQRAEGFAAASSQLVYADSGNDSTAAIITSEASESRTDTLPALTDVLGDGISTIGASSFLRDGAVAVIPASASAVDLFSLTQQSQARFSTTDAELGALNKVTLTITDANNATKSYEFTTKYSDVYGSGEFTDMSQVAALLNQGIFTATNGVDFENGVLKKFSLRDLGGFASGGEGNLAISLATDSLAEGTKLGISGVTDQQATLTARQTTASTIQVLTRDGRHIAGTQLTSDEQASLFTVANGFTSGAVYNTTYLNVDGGYLGVDVKRASVPGEILANVSGTGATRTITFDRLDGIDTDEGAATGSQASAEAASYSLAIGAVTKTVTTDDFGKQPGVGGIAAAMAKKFRDDAPPAVMTGTALASVPAEGSTVTVQFEGQDYALQMVSGEIVITGGETGRLTAYFDASKQLQLSSAGGSLTASAIVVQGDADISNNTANAALFGLGVGSGATPTKVGFTAYDYNIRLDAGKLIATHTDSSATLSVSATGQSLAGERVTLGDMPDEDLIVVLSGSGARRLTASYDMLPEGSPVVARDMTVKVVDGVNNLIEIIDTETGTSMATRTLDATGSSVARGVKVVLDGVLADDDKFHISANSNAGGDNRNMDRLIGLQVGEESRGGFQQLFGNIVSAVGVSVQSSRLTNDAAIAMRDASIEQESAFSGVNLDTEASNLIEQQQAYQASARIMTTARELFRTLIETV